MILASALGARAQITNTGQITGTVYDPSGKIIPGAEVTATNPATKFTQGVKANASGVYVFSILEPGTYEVAATAKGFARAVYDNVVVQVAQTTNVAIKMTIGAQTQTVTVSAATQILQTTSSTLATTLNSEMIENLPLNGRDLFQFATLVPGAANPGIQGTRYTTYNGLPNAALNISVGGTSDQFLRYKTFSSSAYPVAPLREGAFQEATVSTSGLGSASGGEGAAQVQYAVRGGTSQFHGRAFWQAQNSFFNANSWYYNAHGYAHPKSRNNWFGGNLGGPLLPERLVGSHHVYFFANIEYQRIPGAAILNNSVLTSDASNGLYTFEVAAPPTALQLAAAPWITNCTNAGSENTCQANLYALAQDKGFAHTEDPVVQKLLGDISSYYGKGKLEPLAPTPSSMYSLNELYLQNLNWSRTTTTKQWFPTSRLDVDVTHKIHYDTSWDLWWRSIPSTSYWPGSPYVGGYSGFKSTYYTWSNDVTWQISPTMINTTSFGILSDVEEWDPGAISNSYNSFLVDGQPAQVNLPFSIRTLIPYTSTPIPRNNPLFNPSDTLRWTHGNHSFYIGANLVYANMHEMQVNTPPVPSYYTGIVSTDPAAGMFNSTTFPNISSANNHRGISSAESLYAFLTGRVSTVRGGNYYDTATGQYAPNVGLTAWESKTYGGIYFQDSWRTTPHFTVNYGLRWEFTGALHNTNDTYFAPTFANLLGPSGGLFQPGTLNGAQNPYIGINSHPYHGDFVQPAPNLGLAWNPDYANGFLGKLFGGNKTVVRASFSLNPYEPGWETFEAATIYQNPGPSQYYYYSSAYGQFPGGTEMLSSPGIYANAVATSTPVNFQSAIPESQLAFVSPYYGAVDPNIKSPYVVNWTFGIQREIPGNFVVEVDYVGNHSVHGWQNFDLNEVNATSNGFLGQFKNALANYKANVAGGCGQTFADYASETAAGITPCVTAATNTPLFDTAFNGWGITTDPYDSGGYGQTGYEGSWIYDLQQGQAGAMAGSLASNFSYLCNMVGGSFSPCYNIGGSYPINYFQANPYAAGGAAQILSDPASSTYNALQISVRHPVGHGLALGANYAFSKSLGSLFQSYYTDTAQVNYISLRDMALNKTLSDFDVRHVFHAYFTYELPFGHGRALDVSNPLLNGIVGGWNVGSIVSWQSGLPFWLQGGYETFNNQDGGVSMAGVTASQIQNNIGVYLTPDSPYAPVWLNPKFDGNSAIQPNANPGTIGQMLFLHGPGLFNTDISLNKVFPIYERVSLKVQAAFLNAFNHPNWIVGSFSAPGYIYYASGGFTPPSTSASYTGNTRMVEFRTEIDF